MIRYFIPLLGSFFRPEWLQFWYYPLFALAFLATFPRIIRTFLER